MITNAIGKPTTKGAPIINANAESKLIVGLDLATRHTFTPSSPHEHRPSPNARPV